MSKTTIPKGRGDIKRTESKNSTRMLKVLLILKQHSDINHRLTQAQIMEYLKKDADGDLSCNSKTLSATIHELIECVNPKTLTEDNSDYFTIRYSGWRDGIPDKITNIYYMPVIKTGEVESIVEGIRRLDTLSRDDKEKIIKKLENEYRLDRKKFVGVETFSADNMENVKNNTELIIEAIARERQITFHFSGYNSKCGFDYVLGKNGEPKLYTVNPYYVVDYRGKRYMLANTVPHDNISIYRVDLMREIKVTDETRRRPDTIKEFNESKSPQKFMENHLNMMYGELRSVSLKVAIDAYTLVHDFFGDNYKFVRHIDERHDEIEVQASEKGIIDLAMTAPDKIEIIRPFTLRDKLAQRAEELSKRYGGKK